VPAIWLPDPQVRRERELARFRLHLVRHRSSLKNRIHSTLITFGKPCPVSDLFGVAGRKLLEHLDVPDPWRENVEASVVLIDQLDRQIDAIASELKHVGADHPYVPLLMTAPGVGWLVGFSIACEIGDIGRFSSPTKLCGYTGLCPRVIQSGETDRRGPISKHGPKYLRWALFEAALNACDHPSTGSATSAPRSVSVASAGRRSHRSSSPASSPRRSGTCSPAINPLLRQAPLFV
jgi:transposase